tara:strand:- start:782 stop:1066 length:285 start_codon:yes stop_codon:yes gene_type:complete
MKITKKTLREMILQEMPITVSPKDSYNKRMVQYNNGGIEMSVETAWNALQGLEDSIRKSPNADPEFLEKEIQRLELKIDFCRNAAKATFKGRIE